MSFNHFGKLSGMTKGNRITLSDDTKNGLAKLAKPFESVDDCLQRVLTCKCVQKEMEKQEKDEGKE